MIKRTIQLLMQIGLMLILAVTIWAAERGGLRGKVTDVKGKPIEKAKILLECQGKAPVNGTTNDKGEFNVDELEPGDYLISIDAPGYKAVQLIKKLKVESGKTTKVGSDIVLESARAATVLRGSVFTERGFSLPGATVKIERVDGSKFRKDYTTNDGGSFAFRLENGGQYKLTASAKGFETATETVEISDGETRSMAFQLKPQSK